MLTVDALDEGLLVVALARLVSEHLIEASLVECHWVEGCEDTHILELRLGWVTVAVAVNRHIVHDVDIDDLLASVEILMNSLSSGCHGLEEEVLGVALGEYAFVPRRGRVGTLACRVDVALAIGGGNADGGILEHSAEAAHGVTLKVGKVDHEVVVGKVVAYDVIFQVLLILDRYAHLAIFVHDVNSKEAVETMLVDGLPVLLLIHTGAG